MSNSIPCVLAALFALVAVESRAAPAPARIAPDTFLLRGEFVPGRQPDGNTVILRGPDGLVVIDTGRHVEHTRAILVFAAAQAAPIAAVVNTHWHLDHVGGNPLVRKEWPEAMVHASSAIHGARAGFLADYRKQLEAMIQKSDRAEQQAAFRAELAIIDSGEALHPNVVVDGSGERDLGGRELRLGLESRAVTEGDVWIYDAATRVLVAGDLVTLPVPFLDTACPARWRAALETLAEQPFRILVPGHGAPMKRAQFETWRSAFGNLLDCAAGNANAAACATAWKRDAGALLSPLEEGQVGPMIDYYVGQVLRADVARIAAHCEKPARPAALGRRGAGPIALP